MYFTCYNVRFKVRVRLSLIQVCCSPYSELGVALNRGARAQEEGAGAGEGVEFALCLDSLLGSLTALPASQPLRATAGSEDTAASAANVNVNGDFGATSEENVESAEGEQKKSSESEGEPKEAKLEEDLQEQERAEEELDAAADLTAKSGVAAGEASAAKLYMHVSRQPKPDSSLAAFYKVALNSHSYALVIRTFL